MALGVFGNPLVKRKWCKSIKGRHQTISSGGDYRWVLLFILSINQARICNFLDSVHWVQSSEEQHLGILSGSTLSVSQSWTTSERAQHTTSEKKEKSINYTTLKVVSPNFYYRKSPELPFGIKCRKPVSNRIEDNQQIKLLLNRKKQ